jgi:hypothetical protein
MLLLGGWFVDRIVLNFLNLWFLFAAIPVLLLGVFFFMIGVLCLFVWSELS